MALAAGRAAAAVSCRDALVGSAQLYCAGLVSRGAGPALCPAPRPRPLLPALLPSLLPPHQPVRAGQTELHCTRGNQATITFNLCYALQSPLCHSSEIQTPRSLVSCQWTADNAKLFVFCIACPSLRTWSSVPINPPVALTLPFTQCSASGPGEIRGVT